MASKKELEEQIVELKADLAEAIELIPGPVAEGQPGETEIMFSVKKTSLTELKIEKCSVINNVVVEREFIVKDIGAIAKSKLWQSIYGLTQGRNRKDEKRNTNQQKSDTGENNESDSNSGNPPARASAIDSGTDRNGHEELGRGNAATDNNSESSENGNMASGGSDKHGSSSSPDRIDGERDRAAII